MMGCSSGTSSGTWWMLQNSGSEEELQALMDQRKRKRMISNRESARRSRMRKQKHLDDMASLVTQLRNKNHQILTSVNLTTQKYLAVEADNSVLRAQVNELSHRLESLNEIIHFLNSTTTNCVFGPQGQGPDPGPSPPPTSFFELDVYNNNPFTMNMGYQSHPIMASADMMLQY